MPDALVLGLETSCDETAAAIVAFGRQVLSDVVATQVLVHAEYGGVVPEVAARQHLRTVLPVIREALQKADVTLRDLSGIAVTAGPGLVGPLLVGVEVAKSLGFALGIPVVGVNHHAGHLRAVFLAHPQIAEPPPLPHLALLVSGGHTMLVHVLGPNDHRLLGRTRDDAAGEAFDKVAKLLGLGYPGGVQIDRLAATGNPEAFVFPRPLRDKAEADFSFSGLKTAAATRIAAVGAVLTGQLLADFCASFQAAVVEHLVRKTRETRRRLNVDSVQICGGVAANSGLRAELAQAAVQDGFRLFMPPPQLCTDNGAMIAAAGAVKLSRGERDSLDLNVDPGLPLS